MILIPRKEERDMAKRKRKRPCLSAKGVGIDQGGLGRRLERRCVCVGGGGGGGVLYRQVT